MAIIAPVECKENAKVKNILDRIISEDNPIKEVHYLNLRQSMLNGGGPACLRLRVVLTEAELQACKQSVLFSDQLYIKLKQWIEKHYRDSLRIEDMVDSLFLEESRLALKDLSNILNFDCIVF